MSEPSRTVPLSPSPKPGLPPGEARGSPRLEVIVVLLILGASSAVVAPRVGSLLRRSQLDEATERATALPSGSGGRKQPDQREPGDGADAHVDPRSEEHTSELQSRPHLVCRLLLEKKKKSPVIQTEIAPGASAVS